MVKGYPGFLRFLGSSVFQRSFLASPRLCGSFFAFSITAMTRDVGDHGDRRAARATALCLRPSATTPPPISILLKTKAEVQFDKTVTRQSKPVFLVFEGLNPVQFQPCFSVFAVRSAEGRNVPAVPILAGTAERSPLIAIFSKILGRYGPNLSHCIVFCSLSSRKLFVDEPQETSAFCEARRHYQRKCRPPRGGAGLFRPALKAY